MISSDRLADLLGTWFGCGLVPLAPGTVGSFGAIPLHLLLRRTSPAVHIGAIAAVTALGVWSAGSIARRQGQEDPQIVVIDEVIGTLLALGLVRTRSPFAATVAFGLFRLFDATKPGPIKRLEHVKPAGWGIVLDDVAAGVLAGVVARLFR